MSNRIEDMKKGEKSALITTIATFFLAVGKAVAGLLSGSVALLTDAVHSGADLFPILASWFGLRISQKDPDEKFPYGYYKAESLATLFVSIFLIYIAIEFALEGYSKLFIISSISYPLLAGSVASISIIASSLISRYQRKVGEETGSQSLIANSKESLADVFSSCLVLAAIILSQYRIPYAEGIATIIISVFVFKIGGESIRDSVYVLMDISPGVEVREDVEKILTQLPEVESFKNLRCRKSGPFIFGEATVEVREFLDIERGHEIADKIEKRIMEKIKGLESFIVHIEPVEKTEINIAIPIDSEEGLDSEISDHFGRAKYFSIITIDREKSQIKNLEIFENRYSNRESKAGLYTAHDLVERGIDDLITRKIGEISFHTLRDHLVEVYNTEGENVRMAAENYMKGNLGKIDEPTRKKDSPQ